MTKTNNIALISGVTALIIIVGSIVASYFLRDSLFPRDVFGQGAAAFTLLDRSASASTSPNYFGVGQLSSATTTMLDMSGIHEYSDIVIYVQGVASTSASQLVFYPFISRDCIDYYRPSHGIIYQGISTSNATAAQQATVITASSTVYTHVPDMGSYAMSFSIHNVGAQCMRIQANAQTASATIYMEGVGVVR